MTNLLIVESPGKIKKLKAILGSGWEVKASVGHIRQLSNEGTDSLGFTMDNGAIRCKYSPRDSRAKETIANLKVAASRARQVFLACDPDREGETIAWHLADVLKLKNPQRVVYQEITESAVRRAIASPRPLDRNLVAAGRCRDCLDKLVGYKGSPLVWRLNNGAKSVGRVQSATLHIVCQRDREIQSFVPQDYWSVFVEYTEGFKAFYSGSQDHSDPEEEAIDDTGRKEQTQESTRVLSQAEADRLVAIAQSNPHRVLTVQGKLTSKKPPAPFTTSTLQQVAGSRLKFSPEHTMQVAQKIYEAGLITYMRTDSVQLSPEFCQAARQWLQAKDPANVPDKVATQKRKKDAQEAHEAIRPTDLSLSSADLKERLSEDEFKLYFLIWMRAIASQCKPAKIRKTIILSQSGEVQWKARGQVVEFEGYAKYWKDLSGDHDLPQVQPGRSLTLDNAAHEAKQTKPPARYTEPKLVQVMERKGIGRPSTYAPTVKTLKQRDYVTLVRGKLEPTALGLQVDEFLEKALPELLEAEFTAGMEAKLDAIAHGKEEWERYLIGWNQGYFQPALAKAMQGLPAQSYSGPERTLEKSRTKCPSCGKAMSKVPSKKVQKKYFLKCQEGCKAKNGLDLVMFWSDSEKKWQIPQSSPASEADTLTDYPCPVCQKPMAEHHYQKAGQAKKMLRCSDTEARNGRKHKDAVYFFSKGQWWSPKFGVLEP
ncbi:type I DNA topoisomerase [Lyngbya confervoides]|uniref:DNA topoisomerase 1 n=1 Tax=Lyngbya confervoides BDU141951 TaxID=1574623 RepID=A0ABD4SYS3_9CYAN|nr:type I DNA topoisomerase [Lyngbya confervoides]MCM1981617.1 type I DNA topoisomerase [Lyngbya confervoides BDU141951]